MTDTAVPAPPAPGKRFFKNWTLERFLIASPWMNFAMLVTFIGAGSAGHTGLRAVSGTILAVLCVSWVVAAVIDRRRINHAGLWRTAAMRWAHTATGLYVAEREYRWAMIDRGTVTEPDEYLTWLGEVEEYARALSEKAFDIADKIEDGQPVSDFSAEKKTIFSGPVPFEAPFAR